MLLKRIFVLLSLISFSTPCLAQKFSADDILGFWLSESKTGVIEVYKEGEEFAGKLVWLKEIHEGKVKIKLDIENPDEKLQKRSLMNLKNLHGFKFDGDIWSGGKIYDPKKGKTYSAKMTMKSIDKLDLRGYVGISLFGRTSSWTRQKSAIPDSYAKK
ncbi:MAG: DUF2147 domain-containing protein [Halobacteriovoraceae bacterium]|jgi:uncharacterized protein (DUF2147 family)|nr:DUF2147 domain-containing protein [Halobacteriovoraceae bacterium]